MKKATAFASSLCLTCCCLAVVPTAAIAQQVSFPAPAVAPVETGSAPVLTPALKDVQFLAPDATRDALAKSSLGALFGSTLGEFRRLPSKDTLKWLGIGAALATIGHSVDRPVTQTLSVSSRLEDVFGSGERIGGARMQLGGALATYAVGHITRSPKVAAVGADLLQAQLLAQALTAGVKLSVRRTRPDGTQYSFPSGHSSVTFASATVLQRDLGWKVGIPAYGIAAFVAASRIQEKRHFLSDVAFGAAIGIVAGRTVTIGKGDGRFALSPAAAPGGGAVAFTWVGRR